MTSARIPFTRYPGLAPLFLDFLQGLPEVYPDPPTPEACAARGRELLGTRARVPASAWRCRSDEAKAQAEALAQGRSVAAVAGHQVGVFTGPLYTLTKAFDAVRAAREISARGVPAAGAFWALTDDHDLEEIARTAWPGPEGPEVAVLDGADRTNRAPVGGLRVPDRVTEILENLRAAGKAPDSEDVARLFRSHYSGGPTYADAFIETLLDLVDPDPLLVLDPMNESLRAAMIEFFAIAVERRREIGEALAHVALRLERRNREAPVPYRTGVFPFFLIEDGERRRVTDPVEALRKVRDGAAWPSPDVLTRPIVKSFLIPTAASVLGPAEIAYHAQSLVLYPVFGLKPPVLLPRSHLILLGPPERRAAEALGVPPEDLLHETPPPAVASLPEAEEIERLARELRERLGAIEPKLARIDPSLTSALETTREKATYPLQQFQERIRKAAERRDTTTVTRRKKLETMLRPNGTAAERLYPPLIPMLAYGKDVLRAIREAATGSLEGAAVVNLGPGPRAEGEADAG
jgi:bacillithiol biosynthesis cysteine-adding enzyme BshC